MTENRNSDLNSDRNLDENQEIEEAIAALQRSPDEVHLARALTVIRHQAQKDAHFIIAVDSNPAANAFSLRTVTTADGKKWFYAFTGYEEQWKGSDAVMSGFTSPIRRIADFTLRTPEVEGLILNPWNCTLMLSKKLLRIIFPDAL